MTVRDSESYIRVRDYFTGTVYETDVVVFLDGWVRFTPVGSAEPLMIPSYRIATVRYPKGFRFPEEAG